MTINTLKFLSDTLNKVIPYEFIQWTGEVKYPYWVGSYSEITPMNECGRTESTVILTGTTKGSWLELERHKEQIEQLFPSIDGLATTFEDGSGVVVFYSNAFPVPTGDDNLKRMQINLQIKEWKGE